MSTPLHLLFLDPYHLDDPLFISTLARLRSKVQAQPPPTLLLHGGGDQAERLLEAEGHFPSKSGGIIQPTSPQEAVLLERAIRGVNRKLVSTFTDEGIHSVGFHGVDRKLLRLQDDGTLRAGKLAWLLDLAHKGVLPVLSTLVQDHSLGTVKEGEPSHAIRAITTALTGYKVVVVFFTKNSHPGILEGQIRLHRTDISTVSEPIFSDPALLHEIVNGGQEVFVTSPVGLYGAKQIQGTQIFTSKTP